MDPENEDRVQKSIEALDREKDIDYDCSSSAHSHSL